MISQIIEIFRKQAREHVAIKSFLYNRNYEKGSGNDIYPLMWLEDPIQGRNLKALFSNSVNFAILLTGAESVEYYQNLAFNIGLNIIERIKKDTTISSVNSWDYTTIRDYYDDNASGCRFSVNFNTLNQQDRCNLDLHFDENGEFSTGETLNDFNVLPSNGCEVFADKLPTFTIPT